MPFKLPNAIIQATAQIHQAIMRVLIVEDNPDLLLNLCDYLESKGHVTDTARDGVTGLHLAVVNNYDAMVLDVMLPGMDGVTLCSRLRRDSGRATPVLMLTARAQLEDKLAGFTSGADDYLTKPFELRELEARLQVLARRGQASAKPLSVGDLRFDTERWQAWRGDRLLELPVIPMKLLELLLRRSPNVVSRAELENAAWGDSPPTSDALRVHIHALRAALEAEGETPLLRTVRGVGYRLQAAPLA
jgi:DNA-binding response OmpR family regulator